MLESANQVKSFLSHRISSAHLTVSPALPVPLHLNFFSHDHGLASSGIPIHSFSTRGCTTEVEADAFNLLSHRLQIWLKMEVVDMLMRAYQSNRHNFWE